MILRSQNQQFFFKDQRGLPNLIYRTPHNVVRELPTGKGVADLIYLPKKGVNKPALLIELKFDKSAQTAITQIKEKNYLQFFKDYKGEVLLVGINYSKDTKTHQCIIEKAQI